MLFAKRLKAGYTLVEVLVVVSILGILSAMGVAGLQQAVANARVKDAAVNTAAFVERVANLSSQRNEVLCLRIASGDPQRLFVVRDKGTRDCESPNEGIIDEFTIDAPAKFIANSEASSGCPTTMRDWIGNEAKVPFKPRIGLAATPPEGGICIQYGGRDVYGAVRKDKNKNRVVPMWKVGNDRTSNNNWNNWTEL
jgi:prepilin-type N-terminal cleavage/methylation domain-containing protein